MFSKQLQTSFNHLIVLKKDEKITESVVEFCQNNNIKSAWISAIGAVSHVELALYELSKKKYHKQRLEKPLEISSMSGNIFTKDGEIVAHIHGVFSDNEMNAFGGHLIEATVAATCEIYLIQFNEIITRKYSEFIGLNLISD